MVDHACATLPESSYLTELKMETISLLINGIIRLIQTMNSLTNGITRLTNGITRLFNHMTWLINGKGGPPVALGPPWLAPPKH